MNNDSSADENPVEALAAEFAERRRRGEHPSIDEYVARHPALADEIRAFFSALALVEELKPGSDDATDSFAGAASLGVGSPRGRLGDFRLLREIGRGGMGVVYEAEQESLGRHVALKVLGTSTLLDPQKLRRFHREARAAANLHHTHIVPVFGVGEEDGLHYYVMQFIPGLGLDEVLEELKRLRARKDPSRAEGAEESRGQEVPAAEVARSLWIGQFPPAATAAPTEDEPRGPTASAPGVEASGSSSSVTLPGESDLSAATDSAHRYVRSVARIGEQVAEALEYAHQQGTWHRDIKPSNLLLDAHGTVWVTDFGLAKSTGDDDLTHTGDIVGTVRYMAPERFRGRCDARSDVYALGLTLYEMLAYRPAFPASDRHDLIRQITQEEPPRLRRHDPSIPRDLETVVHKAIDKDPAHRYGSARDLAEDLQRFLDDRPIRARRSSATERLARWARRNKGLAASLAAIGLLLVTLAFGSTTAAVWYQKQNGELLWSNYVNLVNRADFEVSQNNIGRAEELLAACPEGLRNIEWHYVKRRCRLGLATLAQTDQDVIDLAYAPDGSWFVSADGDKFSPRADDRATLAVRDARTGAARRSISVAGSIRRVAVSPDGRRIAYAVGFGNSESSGEGDSTGRVVVCDAETLETAWEEPAPRHNRATDLAIHPDGKSLLVGHATSEYTEETSPGGAVLYDLTTGAKIRTFRIARDRGVTAVAFSPDRRTIALAGLEHLELRDATSGESLGVLEPHHERWIFALAFSPDGKTLASGGFDRAIRLWDVRTRRPLAEILEDGFIQDLAFSPDGRWLATANESRAVGLVDLGARRRVGEFRGHTSYVLSVAWQPDSAHLISGGLDRTILLWDRITSRPIVKDLPGWVTTHGFDPTSGHSRIATQTPSEARRDTFTLWDPTNGSSIGPAPRGEPDPSIDGTAQIEFGMVIFSPDGRRIASRKGARAITIREAKTDRVIRQIVGPDGEQFFPVGFTAGGTSLITGASDGVLARWDIATGACVWRTKPASGIACCSPDGKRLIASAWKNSEKGFVRVLDVETGKAVKTLLDRPGSGLGLPSYSRDGTRLALGYSHDGRQTTRVFDLVTGTSFDLEGHTHPVFGVAFSPDGRRLATASEDRTVVLWDLERREAVFTLRGHTAGVFFVSFSPDGQLIASTGFDLTVRVWDARPLD